MALGKRETERQADLFVLAAPIAAVAAGHVFYQKLNRLLAEAGFDPWVEKLCGRTMPRTWAGLAFRPARTSACCWWATLKASPRSGASPGDAAIRSRCATSSASLGNDSPTTRRSR